MQRIWNPKSQKESKQTPGTEKLLEKQKKEAGRKARTKQLIEIVASVEFVLGRDFRDGDNIHLTNFLKSQERNSKYFSKAMEKDLPKNWIRGWYRGFLMLCPTRSVGGSCAESGFMQTAPNYLLTFQSDF